MLQAGQGSHLVAAVRRPARGHVGLLVPAQDGLDTAQVVNFGQEALRGEFI